MSEKIITIECPGCQKNYDVLESAIGQNVRCQCGHTFDITSNLVASERNQQSLSDLTSQAASVSKAAENVRLAPAVNPADSIKHLAQARQEIIAQLSKIIVGQSEVIDQILTAFFAKGHCLLMGVPGLAKTLMVHSLAETLHLNFRRIQFTPDLMPTDITGTNILEEDSQTGQRFFNFHKGPVFCNVLLADEINRTPPKTQAALLEAMQEHKVTAAGTTHTLEEPFLVLATQNPLEQEGTYPLPEAQLDRFLFLVKIDYPNLEEEQKILLSTTGLGPAKLDAKLDRESILHYQELVRQVPVSDHVASYAARLVRASRPQSDEAPEFIRNWVRFGCGPRAGQSLILAAKSHVVLNGRANISCDDIRKFALPVMRHRMILNFSAISEGLNTDDVIEKLMETIAEA
ncbi:MAG: AAA family ATPase [Phycisphaerae bacterium]|nr:AAA family ATPase [Phycisphaerae bacterium]